MKLTTYDDGPQAVAELGRFATAVAARLKGTTDAPEGFGLFPELEGGPHRRQYLHADQTELTGLGPCYRVTLAPDGGELWLRDTPDEGAAAAAVAAVRGALLQGGGGGTKLELGPGAQDATVFSSDGGASGFVFQSGARVAVGTGWAQKAEAESWARRWAKHLQTKTGGAAP